MNANESPSQLENPPKKRRVVFAIAQNADCEVALAGDFNNWEPEPMKYTGKTQKFTKIKMLFPGRYQYKFVINGIWEVDAENEEHAYNDHGSMNSLKIVE